MGPLAVGAQRSYVAKTDDSAGASELAVLLCAVAEADDLKSTLLAAARAACQIAKAARASVLLIDATGAKLAVGASWGSRDSPFARRSLHLNRPLAQFLAQCERTIVPTDIGDCEHLEPLRALCGGAHGVLVAPLRKDSVLRGVVLLEGQDLAPEEREENRDLARLLELTTIAIGKMTERDELRRRVEDLSALVALEQGLPYGPRFEEILGQIIERVKQMVGAEMGGLMLYDAERDELVLQKPALGLDDELIQQTRLPLSQAGISVHVFRTGKPYLTNDLAADPLTLQSFVRASGTRNCVTVPLDVAGRRIGVFSVLNKQGGDFTRHDVRLVTLLASHLGTLIHNARLLEGERQTVAKLQELNQLVERQREGLQRTLAIHDELTRMVLDGQGFAAICANLGRLLANHVAVEDRFANMIGFYGPDAGADPDEGWHRRIAYGGTSQLLRDHPAMQAALARLEQERRPVRLAPIPELGLALTRVVAPVVVGREIMGHVWVLESNRVLDGLDLMAVERAATAVALEMMKEKAAAEAQYKLRGDLVAELLGGSYGGDEALLSRAAYLGIDLRRPRAVLVARLDEISSRDTGRAAEEKVTLKARLVEVLERACRQSAAESVLCGKGDDLVILATTLGPSAPGRKTQLHKLADALRAEVRRWLPEASVSVGIGDCCDSLAEYAPAYQQACHALYVVEATRRRDCTLSFDQLGIYGLLFDPQNQGKLASLVHEALGVLKEYDRRHATELVATLDQYLRHDCHLEETAAALHIHLGTLRYRLQRIEELTGADLRSLEAKLRFHLALSVAHTLGVE